MIILGLLSISSCGQKERSERILTNDFYFEKKESNWTLASKYSKNNIKNNMLDSDFGRLTIVDASSSCTPTPVIEIDKIQGGVLRIINNAYNYDCRHK